MKRVKAIVEVVLVGDFCQQDIEMAADDVEVFDLMREDAVEVQETVISIAECEE